MKGFANRLTLSGFDRHLKIYVPGFSPCSNPGLKLANAFGVLIIIRTPLLTISIWRITPKAFANLAQRRLRISIWINTPKAFANYAEGVR